jgi:hypothetical protein
VTDEITIGVRRHISHRDCTQLGVSPCPILLLPFHHLPEARVNLVYIWCLSPSQAQDLTQVLLSDAAASTCLGQKGHCVGTKMEVRGGVERDSEEQALPGPPASPMQGPHHCPELPCLGVCNPAGASWCWRVNPDKGSGPCPVIARAAFQQGRPSLSRMVSDVP